MVTALVRRLANTLATNFVSVLKSALDMHMYITEGPCTKTDAGTKITIGTHALEQSFATMQFPDGMQGRASEEAAVLQFPTFETAALALVHSKDFDVVLQQVTRLLYAYVQICMCACMWCSAPMGVLV